MLSLRLLLPVLVVLLGCERNAQAQPFPVPNAQEWKAYWNQGKAELTSYTLSQGRYGESHPGHAVLIFVTEPFSKAKQVKLDDPTRAGRDAVTVLKLNHTRKFNTGIYPYSIMRSIFTPVDGSATLKTTSSTQEWCGHVFMQLNQRGKTYEGQLLSYFETEGDQKLQVPANVLLEDEVWTLLRINPNRLPIGEIQILPSSTYLRLRHVPAQAQTAKARWLTTRDGKKSYEIKYLTIDRSLRIEVEEKFPFRILAWSEVQPSGWGGHARRLTTTGVRKAELMTDYWAKHRKSDVELRKLLGLSP